MSSQFGICFVNALPPDMALQRTCRIVPRFACAKPAAMRQAAEPGCWTELIMRIAIIGNSGSGKSTLAAQLSAGQLVDTLDLDTIVWEPNQIAVSRDSDLVLADLEDFCCSREEWIVEGCYGNLIEASLAFNPELIFLNPGLQQCISNCRARPLETHKYASKEEQDSKLEFLLQWVTDYYVREGDMSLAGHEDLFQRYSGPKRLISELASLVPRNDA